MSHVYVFLQTTDEVISFSINIHQNCFVPLTHLLNMFRTTHRLTSAKLAEVNMSTSKVRSVQFPEEKNVFFSVKLKQLIGSETILLMPAVFSKIERNSQLPKGSKTT